MGSLTDTHCHLNLNIFQDDLEQVIERAEECGIGRILVPGIDVETSRIAVVLAERYSSIYAAVGIHPGDASTWAPDSLSILRELASHPKTAAIGEIGLDYYRDRSPRDLQREVFHAQLELAADMALPVIVHNRESMEDLWDELSEWQKQLALNESPLAAHPGVLHSYDGSLADAQRAVENHFFIGISGPVTFKNAEERKTVAAGLPLDNLLVETDAPFLTPHPHRGKRNEPAFVVHVADALASLHGQAVESVRRITWENAVSLFHWE